MCKSFHEECFELPSEALVVDRDPREGYNSAFVAGGWELGSEGRRKEGSTTILFSVSKKHTSFELRRKQSQSPPPQRSHLKNYLATQGNQSTYVKCQKSAEAGLHSVFFLF